MSSVTQTLEYSSFMQQAKDLRHIVCTLLPKKINPVILKETLHVVVNDKATHALDKASQSVTAGDHGEKLRELEAVAAAQITTHSSSDHHAHERSANKQRSVFHKPAEQQATGHLEDIQESHLPIKTADSSMAIKNSDSIDVDHGLDGATSLAQKTSQHVGLIKDLSKTTEHQNTDRKLKELINFIQSVEADLQHIPGANRRSTLMELLRMHNPELNQLFKNTGDTDIQSDLLAKGDHQNAPLKYIKYRHGKYFEHSSISTEESETLESKIRKDDL